SKLQHALNRGIRYLHIKDPTRNVVPVVAHVVLDLLKLKADWPPVRRGCVDVGPRVQSRRVRIDQGVLTDYRYAVVAGESARPGALKVCHVAGHPPLQEPVKGYTSGGGAGKRGIGG